MNPEPRPEPRVETLIHLIRGQRVMLDSDLARLYGVQTKEVNKAVSRNRDRLPDDFVFQLDSKEVANLRSKLEPQVRDMADAATGRGLLPSRASQCCPAC